MHSRLSIATMERPKSKLMLNPSRKVLHQVQTLQRITMRNIKPFENELHKLILRNESEPGEAATSRLILFNKPYGVLSQFTPEGRWQGLKDFIDIPGVYVAGRLDADSEGLLLLTNDGKLQAHIADPRYKMEKTYWVQVEGLPDEAALEALRQGVQLNDGPTRAARARLIVAPTELWERDPPVRFRQSIPTTWLELCIKEGR